MGIFQPSNICFLIKFRKFFIDQTPGFLPCFLIEFRRFFHQLNIRFSFQFLTRLRRFFLLSKWWSQTLYAYQNLRLKRKSIVISWGHISSYVMDLTRSRQFHIITYLEVDLSLIIHHLTYLIESTFQFNLLDQPFKSIFWINLRNQSSH